ncbi:hypothetical protein Tco_0150451 [Tanacetum coccineum]
MRLRIPHKVNHHLLQNKDAKSHNTTKRYVPVEKTSESKKPERLIPKGHRFSHKKTTTVPEKTRTPRSCLRWQPTGRILKTVCLRWVPTGKLLNSCTGKVDSEPAHGSNVEYPLIPCMQTNNGFKPRSSMFKRRLIAADQASVFMAMTFEQRSSSLVLHQMTSDHNRSELGIQDHSNEQSSSKLVPKVVPLAVKTATSRHELDLQFHQQYSKLGPRYDWRDEMYTGIMPTKEELTLETITTRVLLMTALVRHEARLHLDPGVENDKKLMDKGSKERSPPHNLRQKPGQYICCQNHMLIADIENDIMDPVMQCTTLPSHSGFSQQKLISFVMEIHTLSIDISFRDR